MKLWIIILHGHKESAYFDFSIQFLSNLTLQSIRERFSRFHFSSGEFPPIFPHSITTLHGEDSVIPNYNGGNNLYTFHDVSYISLNPNDQFGFNMSIPVFMPLSIRYGKSTKTI